jgi:NAD(P)H-flavin reductase
LVEGAVALLAKADMFFISYSNYKSDMDTNHRSGPPGFVRLDANDKSGCALVYPEYSGTRLYQTLGTPGNSPQAGLVFPDFDTGNVLYITGNTEILVREDAIRVLPRRNIAVRIKVVATRFVEKGLSFRATRGFSPYDPPAQLFIEERHRGVPSSEKLVSVKLLDRHLLTPTIARFRFQISGPEKIGHCRPGQYVVLSFEKEIDIRCSSIGKDDTRSMDNDYIRTFTVSSEPGNMLEQDQFEITIRKVGTVTEHLFRHDGRSELEVPLKGFGGEFFLEQNEGEHVGFVGGGIGITPLLAQFTGLDFNLLQVYWTVRAEDLGLVLDSFERTPGLRGLTKLFVTGETDALAQGNLTKLITMNASVEERRIVVEDLQLDSGIGHLIEKWYVCAGAGLRTTLLEWLKYRNVVFETFNY